MEHFKESFKNVNFSPFRQGFNVVEILFLVIGSCVIVLFSQISSNLNKMYEQIYEFKLDSTNMNLSVRKAYSSLRELAGGNSNINLGNDIFAQLDSAQNACNSLNDNKLASKLFFLQSGISQEDTFPEMCNQILTIKDSIFSYWMNIRDGNRETDKEFSYESFGVFFDTAQPLIDYSNIPINQISEKIYRANIFLSGFSATILFSAALIMRKNRIRRKKELELLKEEIERRTDLNTRLSTEQKKLALLTSTWPDPIFVIDHNEKFILANQATAQLLGISNPELLIDKRLSDFHPTDLTKEMSIEDKKILESGNSIVDLEKQVINQSTGKTNHLLITKTALRDHREEIVGIVGIIRDITAQKEAENALKESNKNLLDGISQLEQRTREMDHLTQMIDLLSACPTMEDAFKVIESQLYDLGLADSGCLYLINASRNNVGMVASWGQSITDPIDFPLSDCWGLRRGSHHIVRTRNSSKQEKQCGSVLLCPHVLPTDPAEYLCIPLVAQGETLGILHLRHFDNQGENNEVEREPSWFSSQRVQRIKIIAESLAMSIASLQLRTTLRQQSIRDPLTGLFNRRYFEEAFERELLRATRSKKNVGLIMIDIDHFKLINDIHGHQAADIVLKELSQTLVRSIRQEDLACRYGGDEFLLLMPEANLETTRQRAEELLDKVIQMSVQYQGQYLDQISISVGVGIFPDHGQTPGALIQSVDRVLYQAKCNGRTQVAVCSTDAIE